MFAKGGYKIMKRIFFFILINKYSRHKHSNEGALQKSHSGILGESLNTLGHLLGTHLPSSWHILSDILIGEKSFLKGIYFFFKKT